MDSLSSDHNRRQTDLRFGQAWYFSRLAKALAKRILSELGSINDCVLDVGCGFGKSSVMIQSSCNYVIGVDIQNNFDRSKISPRLDFCLADAFKLPFRDDSFGALISVDVIEHVPDYFAFLLEIKRVIQAGGVFILATPNKGRLSNQLKRMIGKPVKFPLSLGRDPLLGECVHLREFSKSDVVQLLSKSGFVSIDVQGAWLGIPFRRIEIGLSSFPDILDRYSQYLVAKSVKPI